MPDTPACALIARGMAVPQILLHYPRPLAASAVAFPRDLQAQHASSNACSTSETHCAFSYRQTAICAVCNKRTKHLTQHKNKRFLIIYQSLANNKTNWHSYCSMLIEPTLFCRMRNLIRGA